jgi:hypothetical protein
MKLSEVLKDYCCRCAQSRKKSTLRSVQGLSHGVCARVFVETQNCVKLRKDKASKFIEEKHRESVSWECLNRHCKVTRRRDQFSQRNTGFNCRRHQKGRN